MAKLQPAVKTLNFNLTVGDAGVLTYDTIDLSQCASIANRRFYRQGLNWAVAGMSLHTVGTGFASILKIPDTWVSSNAWHKAMAFWLKQQNEAIADSESQSAVAKFRDFKVFMDVLHEQATVSGNLIPYTFDCVTNAESLYKTGEWEASQVVLPNAVADASGSEVDPAEYYLHMVGANRVGDSKGIIDGYQSSRAYPQSPDPVSPTIGNADNWMNRMFNVGNDNPEVVSNATDKNDDLPYDQDEYPGSETNASGLEIVSTSAITSTTIGGTTTFAGTNFPCGLIRISNQSSAGWSSPPLLQVHLVPGSSRGYLTSPMQDM
jgi:hypothetical protein